MKRSLELAVVISAVMLGVSHLEAGMGSPIPTELKIEELPQIRSLSPWIDARLQTLSFFLFGLLMLALVVRFLWNTLRRDWQKLPELSFKGACAVTGLWALLSVVILTMISGARELMTPGAWKQHGWTYRLADQKPSEQSMKQAEETRQSLANAERMEKRRQGIEKLSIWLTEYAARHGGAYPAAATADPVWEVPTYSGSRYLYLPGLVAEDSEPEIPSPLAAEPPSLETSYMVTLDGAIGVIGKRDVLTLFKSVLPEVHVDDQTEE